MANNTPILLGRENTATDLTIVRRSGPSISGGALRVRNDQPAGVALDAVTSSGVAVNAEVLTVGTAVTARAGLNPAVEAESPFIGVLAMSEDGLGVSGVSRATMPYQQGDLVYPAGVYGRSPANVAVVGQSDGAWGVLGRSQSATAGGVVGVAENAGGIGVRGDAAGGDGVLGVSAANGAGVVGRASGGHGVQGFSSTRAGVFGSTQQPGQAGVEGRAPSGPGLLGVSDTGSGVYGSTVDGAGVVGFTGRGQGVFGACNAPGPNNVGVYGTSPTGAGVRGHVSGGVGVQGTAEAGTGVVGEAPGTGVAGSSRSGDGVVGYSTERTGVRAGSEFGTAAMAQSLRGVGLVALSLAADYDPTAISEAARFFGNVTVSGDLIVTGAKSAAASHPDGTLRRLYCVESPQSWFEDFGEATLSGGVARIPLDPDFAALVQTDGYHVFVTPHDPVQLYVSDRRRDSFEIRAVPGAGGVTAETVGTVTAGVSYRVVARRADVPDQRLEQIPLPQMPTADTPRLGTPTGSPPPTPSFDVPVADQAMAAPEGPPPVSPLPTLPRELHPLSAGYRFPPAGDGMSGPQE
jgi:hypothetical protein